MATMKESHAEALAKTLVDKLSKIRAETLANTIGHLHFKTLLYKRCYRRWLTRWLRLTPRR